MYYTYHYYAIIEYGFIFKRHKEVSGIISFVVPIKSEKMYTVFKQQVAYFSKLWMIREVTIKSLTVISND